MWIPTPRKQHSRPTARYQTDLTDKEWRLIEPRTCLPRGRQAGPAPGRCGRSSMRSSMCCAAYASEGGRVSVACARDGIRLLSRLAQAASATAGFSVWHFQFQGSSS